MMRYILLFILPFISFFIGCSNICHISGTVIDKATGEGINNVDIKVTGNSTSKEYDWVITNQYGNYLTVTIQTDEEDKGISVTAIKEGYNDEIVSIYLNLLQFYIGHNEFKTDFYLTKISTP